MAALSWSAVKRDSALNRKVMTPLDTAAHVQLCMVQAGVVPSKLFPNQCNREFV